MNVLRKLARQRGAVAVVVVLAAFVLPGLAGAVPAARAAASFDRGQCTWWADQKRPDIYATAVARKVQSWDWNAYRWAEFAQQAGFLVDTTPAVGAIAVWPRNTPYADRKYGHVAYVEAVYPDGSFKVSEYNWTYKLGFDTRDHIRPVPGQQFIHGLRQNPPPPPSGLNAPTITTSSATLAWSPVGGADGYVVFLNGARVGSVAASTTSYTFGDLSCATGYTLGVEATQAGQVSSPATKAVTTTACRPSPVPTPTGLAVVSTTSSSATLAWSPVGGADGYVLFLNGSRVTSIAAAAGPGGTTYTFAGLTCGTSYTLGVEATKTGQVSSLATQAATTSRCARPQVTLTVVKAGSGTVTSSVGGINCGTACSAVLDAGTAVTLTASPAAGSTFGGWSGACSGTGTCVLTADSNATATATFNASGHSGTVTVPPGQTLNVRVDHNTTSQVTTSLANGTAVWIVCQTQGTPVNGMWGWTTLWDRLSIGGYASDGFVNTGTNAQVAPNC